MKLALCNEVLQPMPFAQQCTWAAAAGRYRATPKQARTAVRRMKLP